MREAPPRVLSVTTAAPSERRRVKASSEKPEKRAREDVGIPRLAFPDDQNLPPSCRERFDILHIAVDIPLEFGEPEILPRLRNAGLAAARMLMPKTSMDEDRRLSRRKHDIRFSGEILSMQAKTEPERVRGFPNLHLWHRVFLTDSGHQPGAMFGRKSICQRQPRQPGGCYSHPYTAYTPDRATCSPVSLVETCFCCNNTRG